MRRIYLSLVFLLTTACGSVAGLSGEDHGNIAAGDLGVIVTEDEHPTGWGESDCFFCHNMQNVHQVDRTGTGLNMDAIQNITETQGLDSCAACHGSNGL